MKNLVIILMVAAICMLAVDTRAQSDGGFGEVVKGGGLSAAILGALKKSVEKVPQAANTPETRGKAKNLAAFRPTAGSNNLESIASELAKTPEDKVVFLQLFIGTKQAYEEEAAKIGAKNNVAGAMTFLLSTCVTVYNDAAEPSDEVTQKLFDSLNAMFDAMPEMAAAPAKDKEFLYDTYISFGGMVLAGYTEAKQSNNKDLLNQFHVLAGGLLQQNFGVDPTKVRFDANGLEIQNTQNTGSGQSVQPASRSHTFKKQITNFDDGWTATPTDEYVSVQKNGTEIRLFYVNADWDQGYSNMVQQNDYYWAKAVTPYFNVSNVQTWSGVEYPIIYFRQADAVDRQTGRRCFVSMKIVFQGGANVIVAVTPNRAAYEQQFKHPDDLNWVLNRNKFAVTADDMIGTWAGSGGGGVEYYSAYTGTYAGMNALSTSDNFVFSSDGSYRQTYLSAQVATGGSQFARIDYRGRYSATDWEVTATNHYGGKTAKFAAQLIAVRGGYLLTLTDQRNGVRYMLFKQK